MSEAVRLSRGLADEMILHCIEGRPNEACGMLGAKDGEIVKVFKMANASASPVRYALEPGEQLAVYNALDSNGWELGGVFHSHTHTEAYPSPTDVRLASEDVPYLIVSLAYEPAEIRAFRIVKESWTATEGEIEELPVTVA
ncbi:MAG: M67 family metallopeptidase [Actinomycetota bacterium]|nr:M67 family metallopeptidase [Actinomycetota bacterium]